MGEICTSNVQTVCGRCYKPLGDDPDKIVGVGGISFHKTCDAEGLEAIRRAHDQGKRFGFRMPPVTPT